jgi:hypothetical protein
VTKRITKGSSLAVALVLLLANACAEEESQSGRDATGSEIPSDPSGADRPAAQPPSSSPIVAPPIENRLLEWSFEPASADCNGWAVFGADAIRAAPPRSGAYSCKLCGTGEAALSLSRDLGVNKAGHYTLTAWVRKRPQNAAPDDAVAQIDATRAGEVLATGKSTRVAVREEWDRLEASVDLSDNDATLRITIGSETASADRCLFIDDVTITRD